MGRHIQIDNDRAGAVYGAGDLLSGNIGLLSDFAKPPGTIEGVVPNRGFDGQGSRDKVGPVDVGGD